MTVPQESESGPPFPGGEHHRGYAIAFQVWMVLFLVILCIGLLNFIASCWPANIWPKTGWWPL